MQQLLEELKLLLREEIALHEGLRDDLAFECRQDGQLGGADTLQLQQRKYHRVHQIEALEARRIDQVRSLAREWGHQPASLTLREIIARSPAPLNDEFQQCHTALNGLVEDIRGLARESGANAQARLKAIDATLAVIGEAVNRHQTYSEAGRIKQRPPTFKQTSA